jgi:ribosomal protein S18 acetylase RimI-like enzyme
MDAVATRKLTIRELEREDLGEVVAIDAVAERRPRRAYFERRFDAALHQPTLHAQYAACDGKGLAGYIFARVLEGEFGRAEPGLQLEAIGVRGDLKGQRVGARLFDTLCDYGRRYRMADIRTQAPWTNHAMLRWLDAMCFALAPHHVVDCAVAGGQYSSARDDPVATLGEGGPAHEIDYGAKAGNDFERLARDDAEVCAMDWNDVGDVVRIDRAITGRDRGDYMKQQLAEAMQESAVRVSLTARRDGVAVGFVMARVDLGDFGRVEPVAVADTIGVDPEYSHRGIGRALLSQLFVNLGGLRIERVETVVAPRDFALLGFLYDVGFRQSQRLPFVRRLG